MSSSAQKQSGIDVWFPVGIFVFVLAAIVWATLYYAPSWGLMDDFGLLKVSRALKVDPSNIKLVTENFITSGMLRPFYYSWAAVFYAVFEKNPTAFYIFIAVWNMAAMVFWGSVFFNVFAVRKESRFWTVFFYPLTFLLFTPFWNIFNYLSLQEKFVVFFAPLVIYFFQKLYKDFHKTDLIWLYVFMFCGLMSKATFVYVPCILFVYALADLIIIRYRPSVSWLMAWINGIIFMAYAVFTLTFQIHGNYTAKYKDGLAGGAFLGKIFGLSIVMKSLLLIGIFGFVGVILYAKIKKRPEVSLACMIYAALAAYIVLLLPWGSQSYLISAIGPLALGALFPIYIWLNQKGIVVKCFLNAMVVMLLCFVFIGNCVPNIRRMGEIGRTITFLREQNPGEKQRYFMPPPYVESGDAVKKFTDKDVVYCADGRVSADMLAPSERNYLVTSELFSAMELSGVSVKGEVYSNQSWKVFELVHEDGHQEILKPDFPKTMVQRLKAIIREF